ncbi:helix-turn-helix transcriptional regulator [Tetragenococcus koreensis]|uniref:winged helix-turn-helix transcriptional regulator n=1 Tax=Tetragenococcus koreensis TaxID=290335 RepID=UPI001F1B48C8|nr:helix-turn-helix domain-containing protein [Tetragenococcus koreensis]MDN6507874.1 helix-turn-helix transcriptional regulator [Tetragenococcus halophilus]MDN6730067.1 helix-turn-helix transcriptional regulator [Alkalibacterium sp.]MCF1585253.1 helix-turn-helix transcriptional regulator [Tetragenococcus koreensis]MCF1614236.1 helix-turn-helix transcriptional regulator [Tetragenococcus koreensis]MCF1618391.1 helix-turn-helix transcriptional regulator [Tetragenococcus koreensis]
MSLSEMESFESIKDTPFGYTLSIISGKYKMTILYWLVEYESIRFNELQRLIGEISHRTLTQQLKELQNEDIIMRSQYNEIPPRVEYSLTKKGKSLYPLMDQMCEWGEEWRSL